MLVLNFSACDEGFLVNAPYTEFPIVYGFLNAEDDQHFLRIQKSFIGNEEGAISSASIADSLYYEDDLIIRLNSVSNPNGLDQHFLFTKVEANDFDIFKETGIFSSSPYFLYYTEAKINYDEHYELIIFKSELEQENPSKIANSSTLIVGQFPIVRPEDSINPINLVEDYTVKWRQAKNAVLYDIQLEFNFLEASLNNLEEQIIEERSLTWKAASNIADNEIQNFNPIDFTIQGKQFLNAFALKLKSDSSLLWREMLSVDLTIIAGTQEQANFNSAYYANNSLASSNGFISYSNIEGGLGLFSSIQKESQMGIPLSANSINALACDSATNFLKFRSSISNIYYPECE